MPHRDPSSPTPLPTILRYGIAVLSVAIATGLDFFLVRHFEIRLTPFLFAVGATVWYAGTGPGVLAIVLAVVSLDYFFVPPLYSFGPISKTDLVDFTFCTLCALAVGWVSAARRRAEQGLRQARDELEARVAERTADLQRSERYLAEAQRLSHTGSWVWNVAARESTHWSQETYRLYGFDPEGGIPGFEAFLERVHSEDRDRLVDDLERAIRERADHEMTFRAVLPDGTIKYIHGIGRPIFDASGDVVEFVGAAMDITERKRAEETVQRLAAIVESSNDAIVSKDLNGIITSWNKGAERLFGYTAAEIVGKPVTILIPPERHDEELVILERIRRGEPIDHYETLRRRKDGTLVDISLTVSPVKNADGRIIGASKIARDITERKQAEQVLHQAQAELAHVNRVATMGQLTTSIAHEVKQPIAAAVTNAQAALRWLGARPPDLAEVRQAVGRIVEDGKRAGDVIDRIRALTKKAPQRKDWFDLNEAVLDVIALTRSEVLSHRISLRTQLATGLPLIGGDRVQVQQVVLNLVLNAVQAMSTDSDGLRDLLISTEQSQEDGVLVAVRDSGPGIDPDIVERVFQSFYTTKPSGMGMGLSICRSIVEAHGGRLEVIANKPRGAIFQFILPAHPDSAS